MAKLHVREWGEDHTNPYISEERRAAIFRARAERAAEIEEWKRKHPKETWWKVASA